MNEPLKRIRLKCRYEGDIRTVAITPESEYVELKKRLSSDYGFDVSLKYEDKDGDFIILSSQHDLDDLFIFGENETVNVNVSETLFLPYLQLKGSSKSSGTVSSTMPPVKDWSRNGSTNSVNSHGNMLRPIVVNNRVERFPNINDNSSPFRHESSNIRWKRAEMLGQGAFGVVYLGLNIDTGELMAVKQMATEEVSKRELSSLENEISLLRNLRHPNIVRYIGTELTQSSLSIFLEYVPGGSLKALIDKFGRLEEAVAKSYTRQLLIGLEYLHRNGIAHRDIKGANCLVGNDGVIKLADFGNSKHWRATTGSGPASEVLHQTQQISSGDIKGTPSWMAPEIVRDQATTINWKKADVWSLACTTLEMTTGRPPWSQFGNSVTILYHLACQDTLPEYPEPASVELVTFLNVCLQRDPAARPDITSLLLHSFVSSNILPSGQNLSSAAGWGAPYSQQQQQSGSQLFANRPSTVSSAVFSQWDSPHSNQQSSRAPSRAPIGNTVQTVVSSVAPLNSPRGAQHRYSYSESNAAVSVIVSPRPTPLGFQDNSFPMILTARERSFRGEINVGVDHEQRLITSRRSSMLLAAQTTSSLLRDNDPEVSHERPQSGLFGDSHAGKSLLTSDQHFADGDFTSRSPLGDPDDEAPPPSSSDTLSLSRAGLMPPLQMGAKPKIRDRTGKRASGGKKTRKRQQVAAADLVSDGEASVSSLQSGAMSAARNRKAAASPLPVSPAKRTPSASQTNKDAQKIVVGKVSAESTVPPLDINAFVDRPMIAETKTEGYDSDESTVDATGGGLNKTTRIDIDENQRDSVGLDDSFAIESSDFTSCASTARLPPDTDTARVDDPPLISPLTMDDRVSEESIARRICVEEQLVPLIGSVSLDEGVLTSRRRGEGVEVSDSLSITCSTARMTSTDALDPQTGVEQQFYEPCLSPYLSHSVDGSVDQEPLLDVSASLSMPVATPKATADVPHHAPLTRTASRTNAAFMAKSVDLSMTVRGGNSASRQQLYSRSVQVADSRDNPADLLDISCDSLEALQVQGLKPPRTAVERDVSRTSSSNAPNRRLKRVSTADPQHYADVADESRMDSSLQGVVSRDEIERRILGEAQLLDEHSSWVTRLRAPQRTALLVSASTDGTIRIWGPGETASRAVLDTATFAQSMAKQEGVNEKPDKKISTTEADGSISSTRTVKVLNAWAEDSCDTVWAACSDGALRVWSGAEGRPLRLLKGHDEPVTAMEGMDASGAISGVQQSACLVSTGSADRTVRIWDVRAKKAQVFLFRGHGDTVLTLRWGEGGRSLISGGKDKTIRIWDTRAGRLRSTLEKHFGAVGAIRMFPSGSGATSNISFFSAGRDSVLNAWTANGDCVFSQTAHRGAATFLSEINFGRQQINGGGPLMASLGADNIVKLWDLRRVRIVSEIQSPVSVGNVFRAVWCGQSLVVSSSSGLVRQYDHQAGGLGASTDNVGTVGEWSSRDLASHGQASTDLIATDSFLASSSRSGQILRWNYS